MKKFFKQAVSEMFKGCTPLQIVKQIVATLIILIMLIVISGADSIGGGGVLLCLCISAVLWKVFGLNDAFPEDEK